MVILMYSLCFAAVMILTKSYKHLDRYYSTVQFVSFLCVLYEVICRGFLPWRFETWWIITDKLSLLIQTIVLLPCTTVLFLRYFPPSNSGRVFYFILFIGLYVLMEGLLVMRHEIVYQHGWTFGWSVFIDVCLFFIAWIHARSWKVAVPISVCITAFLTLWFNVPLTG